MSDSKDDETTACGRRTCDRDAAVTYTTTRGALRTRCPVHALADGVDGVGESRAETILDVYDLEDLVELSQGADGSHCPAGLSSIDGLGPSSAATIMQNLDESPVADAVRERADEEIVTDGGQPGGERIASDGPPSTAALLDQLDATDKHILERIAKEGGR